MGGVEHLAGSLVSDLSELFPHMNKSLREKLAIMIATLIDTRSCNTMELASRLLAAVCRHGQTIVVSLDQTSPGDDRTIGMVALRRWRITTSHPMCSVRPETSTSKNRWVVSRDRYF